MTSTITFLVKWARLPLEDELRSLAATTQKSRVTKSGDSIRESDADGLLRVTHLNGPTDWSNLSLWFPPPRQLAMTSPKQSISMTLVFQVTAARKILLGGPELDFFAKNTGWGWVKFGEEIEPREDFDVAWALRQLWILSTTLPIEYGALAMSRKFSDFLAEGNDPKQTLWPHQIFRPNEGQREALEKWKDEGGVSIEELPGGRIWFQAATNPFLADSKKSALLAQSLGLAAPPKLLPKARK